MAHLAGQNFVIFDCEGLFSYERDLQEEMQMLLMLSAISDVMIMNQDLTFNKQQQNLLDGFIYGIDRLTAENQLFKGRLSICIRDVGKDQFEEANEEYVKFRQRLIDEGKQELIKKLFQGDFSCFFLQNNEQHEAFEQYVGQI